MKNWTLRISGTLLLLFLFLFWFAFFFATATDHPSRNSGGG